VFKEESELSVSLYWYFSALGLKKTRKTSVDLHYILTEIRNQQLLNMSWEQAGLQLTCCYVVSKHCSCFIYKFIIIIIIIIFYHALSRLTCSGIDALPSFPGASTISSSSRFVVDGVFRQSGVVHSFKVVDPVLFVFESHVLYSRDLQFFSYDFASYIIQSCLSRNNYPRPCVFAYEYFAILGWVTNPSDCLWVLCYP